MAIAWVTLFLGELAGYLIGAIPFAYLIARVRAGIDIRTVGSGNVGATNVGRLLGFRYFVLCFLLDFLKGVLPVSIAIFLRSRHLAPADEPNPFLFLPELVGLATILGHVYPVFLKFKGGKGVATTIGVLGVLTPTSTLLGLAAFLVLLMLTRMVSVGSIGFATMFALSFLLTTHDPLERTNIAMTVFVLVVASLIVIQHRSNVGRIIAGTESQVRLPWDRATSPRVPQPPST